MSEISRYEMDKYISVFNASRVLQQAFIDEGITTTGTTIRNLVQSLLSYREEIFETSIDKLVSPDPIIYSFVVTGGESILNYSINIQRLDRVQPGAVILPIPGILSNGARIVSVNEPLRQVFIDQVAEDDAQRIFVDLIPVPLLRNRMSNIFNKPFISANLYRLIMYTFKYSSVKTFFFDNWKKFTPDFDALNILKAEQTNLLQESFMKEYDRFSQVIDEIYNIQDIDRVPNQYLSYIAQLVGYERGDSVFLFDASFRELVKNIIEIYKIKGTNFSFELFFNFLGFQVEISEFWFDARYADSGVTTNPFTQSSDRESFSFYLTPIKPTDYIPENMRDPFSVTDDMITGTLDGNMFNFYTSQGEFSFEQLLGLAPGYREQHYRFFKTNVMEFRLDKIIQDSSGDAGGIGGDEEGGGLSADELRIIQSYANFLTPIFISKNIVVVVFPFEDDARDLLTLSDFRRDMNQVFTQNTRNLDPENRVLARLPVNEALNFERFFSTYSGDFPRKYFFQDGLMNEKYGVYRTGIQTRNRWDFVDDTPLNPFGDVEPNGHFISGYHRDTFERIFDRTNPDSVISQIALTNPSWSQSQILEEIERLISTPYTINPGNGETRTYELFAQYSIRERDILNLLKDEDFFTPFSAFNVESDFSIRSHSFFASTDKPPSFHENYNKFSYYQEPEVSITYNKASINSLIVDNGNGESEILINYGTGRFLNFNHYDKFKEENRLIGDFQQGTNIISNVEYDWEVAPEFSSSINYIIGDLVRVNTSDPDDDEVIIFTSNQASGQSAPLDGNFSRVYGIKLAKIGDHISVVGENDRQIFGYRIIDIKFIPKYVGNEQKGYTRELILNKPLPLSATELKFSFFNDYYNAIKLRDTLDVRNTGVYIVKNAQEEIIDGDRLIRLTLHHKLVSDQINNHGVGNYGFLSLYFPKITKQDRTPTMWNKLEMSSVQIGDSMTSYIDQFVLPEDENFETPGLIYHMKAVYDNDYPNNGMMERLLISQLTYDELTGEYSFVLNDFQSIFDQLNQYEDFFTTLTELPYTNQIEGVTTFYDSVNQDFIMSGQYLLNDFEYRIASNASGNVTEDKFYADYIDIYNSAGFV